MKNIKILKYLKNIQSISYNDFIEKFRNYSANNFTYRVIDELIKKCEDIRIFLENGFTKNDMRVALINFQQPQHHFCSICNKEIHSQDGRTFRKTCADKKCVYKQMQITLQETCMQRYGVSCIFSLPENIEKQKKTKLERYGTLSPYPYLSAALMEKYGVSCTFNIPGVKQKIENSMIINYGSKSYLSLPIAHEQAKKTKLERYGNDNYNNTEQIKKTKLERYGDEKYNNVEQIKKTFIEHYGVDNNMKSKEGLERYRKSINKKYGKDYFIQTDKFQKSHSMKYFQKTGYTHQSRNPNVQKKMKASYFYDNQYFKTSWEIAFYIWHKDNGIQIEHNPKEFFWYQDDVGKQHTYHPDFKVDGKLYEVKGSQFIKNDGTYQNPYDHAQDAKYEAKHQCMISNGIIIIGKDEIIQYLTYIESKYGKDYIKNFKSKN